MADLHSDVHTHESDYGIGKKTLGIYVIGVVLCIILTLIPFFAVMSNRLSSTAIWAIIFPAAFLQFLAQVLCFLRLNVRTEQSKITVLAFVGTIITLAVIVAGSLWIMYTLDYNMMN